MPPTGVSSSSSLTSSSSYTSTGPVVPPCCGVSRPRPRLRPRPRRLRPERSSSSWLALLCELSLPPWLRSLPPRWLRLPRWLRSLPSCVDSPLAAVATASLARRARSVADSADSGAPSASRCTALWVSPEWLFELSAGLFACLSAAPSVFSACLEVFSVRAGATPPLLMAATRSLFFILDTPATPSSEARAWSCVSFMAVRAALVLPTTVVSVTRFLSSHEPRWLQRCELPTCAPWCGNVVVPDARYVECRSPRHFGPSGEQVKRCLLYTSDAADDLLC